ncbi:hypothetical protein [Ciceribacter sp. L1K23]|uniref:ImuA family protein n=1 Tax=Ciceribacter sp. L1K23 TaxID=2820276 RepID=UPI002012C90A|nr:hypothetical protein [Ciceribacter sp. L1K23]
MAERAMTRETLFALREAVARIEGKPAQMAREVAMRDGDDALLVQAKRGAAGQSGDPLSMIMEEVEQGGAFIEIRSARLADAGAASGFALALSCCRSVRPDGKILLIGDRHVAREAGLPYAPGLDDFGHRRGELVYALPRRIEDALWLADEALACGAFATVILEVHGNVRQFGLTESRRLGLKARSAGGTLLLMRQAGEEEASSASLRLRVEAAPSAIRNSLEQPMPMALGNPLFRLTVEKSRSAVFSEFLLEWSSHERRLAYLPSAVFQRSPHPVDQLSAAGDRSDRKGEMGRLLALDRAS